MVHEIRNSTVTIEMFSKWLEDHFSTPYSRKTQRVYLSVISGLFKLKEEQAISNFSEFDQIWLRKFIGWNYKTGEIYSQPYQTLRAAALNILWYWLIAVGLVKNNPVSDLLKEKQQSSSLPAGGKRPQRLPIVLMWEDQEILLSTIQRTENRTSVRDYAMIALTLATGLRCEEICNMQLPHLDLAYQRLRIVGKGNKERLVIFEHDQIAVDAIENWLKERAILLRWLDIETDSLFISRTGKPLTKSLVYQQVSKYIRLSGLANRVRGKGAHLLRHTATSIMFARRVPILQIQENLGHGELTTTHIYAHLLPQEKNYAASQSN